MLSVYDHTIPERPLENLNTLKEFLKRCLELMQDEASLKALHGMIHQFKQDIEVPMTQK
jgi:hypothetical protein